MNVETVSRDKDERQKTPSDLNTNPQKVLDRPKQYIEMDKPNKPIKMTGFRPIWSDTRLQCSTVSACVAKNSECYGVEKEA